MSEELPEGWAKSKLGDLCSKPQYGWTTSGTKTGGRVKLLRTSDISGGRIDWTAVPWCEREPEQLAKYFLAPGDVVVSRAGSVGISQVIPPDCPEAVFASYLIRFRPLGAIPSGFLALFLNSPAYWTAISDRAAGIAVQNDNARKLAELEIPVPPLAEQRRIVAKVEEILQQVGRARERLAKVPDILKHFGRAVLTAACSGWLTDDWRARGSTPKAAVVLLQEARGEVLSTRLKPQRTLNVEIEPEPFELPRGWEWAAVADLCTSVSDGDHQAPPKAESGVPFLVIGDISGGRLNLGSTMFVPRAYFGALPHERRPARGDILYSVTGSFGIAVQVDTDAEFCFQRHLALLKVHPLFCSAYVHLALSSEILRRQAAAVATGIAQLTVPLSGLRALRVPVPPLAEQVEIVRRVGALLALGRTVERKVGRATAHVARLTAATLSKAFAGELVSTEAELARMEARDYEPARGLLDRIEAERAAHRTPTPGRRAPARP